MGNSVTVTSFRDHPLYPRISRAVAALLKKDKVVRPVDVLVEMQLLKREHLEDWRFGRVPYLDRLSPPIVASSRPTDLSRIAVIHQSSPSTEEVGLDEGSAGRTRQ